MADDYCSDRLKVHRSELRSIVQRRSDLHFINYISKIDDDILEELINKRYTTKDHQELTLLIEAALNGNYRIVKYMLEKLKVNVDEVGKVKHFGSVVDGATALWCAAGSGHLEVVKVLIAGGAKVDYCTETKSTPLRAACFSGEADIVDYLIEHGADVNVTNVFNSTCLMIAAYKDRINVVLSLLKNGADINKQTKCGATAMHFAAQANNYKIVELLLAYDAKHLKNGQSLTPILVAAERTHHRLVYYLLDVLNLTREERIEVKELLGASFLNDKDNYDFKLGYSYLLRSMEMRYNDHLVIPKKVYKRVEAYDNHIECQTVEDLVGIKSNSRALHYESLIIRERILGENNPDLLQSIIYRGAVYADSHDFTPCIKLWKHAMKIAQNNKFSAYKDLLRFTQVFCKMIKVNVKIELPDLKDVLKLAVEELKMNKKKLSTVDSIDERKKTKTEYSENMWSILALIIITSITLAQNDNAEDYLKGEVMKMIVKINRLNLKTESNETLLHLCLKYGTHLNNAFSTGICCFPNYLSMKLLIYCGADVNAMDNFLSTPLHYVGSFISDFPLIPHNSDDFDTKRIVMELLNAGAHTDYMNVHGECPHTGYLKNVLHLTNNMPRSLKCISAKVLKYVLPEELYRDQLPKELVEFTNLH